MDKKTHQVKFDLSYLKICPLGTKAASSGDFCFNYNANKCYKREN